MNDDIHIDSTKLTDKDRELAGLKGNRIALQTSIQRIESGGNINPKVLGGEKRSLREIESRMNELDATLEEKPAAE